MRSRNWVTHRRRMQELRGVPCSLRPSDFEKVNPWEDVEAPPPPPPSAITSILQACKDLIGDAPIPKPDVLDEDQAARRLRLDKHAALMRRLRAEKRGFSPQGGRTKMSRYYRKITGRHEI